jgi:hypothetical protein
VTGASASTATIWFSNTLGSIGISAKKSKTH